MPVPPIGIIEIPRLIMDIRRGKKTLKEENGRKIFGQIYYFEGLPFNTVGWILRKLNMYLLLQARFFPEKGLSQKEHGLISDDKKN
jgi:hypothetical protein